MLNSSDWASMQADLEAVRGDNEVTLTLRRGSTTLAAQKARVAGKFTARRFDNSAAEESRTTVTLLLAVGAEVQPEDRFTLQGRLYRIMAVRPNKRAAVMADAELIE